MCEGEKLSCDHHAQALAVGAVFAHEDTPPRLRVEQRTVCAPLIVEEKVHRILQNHPAEAENQCQRGDPEQNTGCVAMPTGRGRSRSTRHGLAGETHPWNATGSGGGCEVRWLIPAPRLSLRRGTWALGAYTSPPQPETPDLHEAYLPLAARWLPKPGVLHAYPCVPFDHSHPRASDAAR